MTSQDSASPLSPNSPTDFEWKPNKTGGATIRKLLADAENVVVPAEIDGLTVTEIGADAFAGSRSLVSLVLPPT
ncbi:MAG: hypothetical protein IJE97_00720, partial [Thermoguttaceae bacterium]|nr:hypothetical protein [Thermoguttaceae bacterium]